VFDSHCHLDFEPLSSELGHHLSEAWVRGVRGWFVPGCFPNQWLTLQKLRKRLLEGEFSLFSPGQVTSPGKANCSPSIYFGAGLHPYWSEAKTDIDKLCSQLAEACVGLDSIAIGECGLHRGKGAPLEVQQKLFEAQLQVAHELDLPIVIHEVGARSELLQSIARVGMPRAGAVVHGFGGSVQWGEALIARGALLGIGPAVTRPQRKKLRNAVCELPLESFVLETDAPDQRIWNSHTKARPVDLLAVCACVAQLRHVTPSEVAFCSDKQARSLFQIKNLG